MKGYYEMSSEERFEAARCLVGLHQASTDYCKVGVRVNEYDGDTLEFYPLNSTTFYKVEIPVLFAKLYNVTTYACVEDGVVIFRIV